MSKVFDGFKFSEPSARFFDAAAARVGAAVAGRTTYEHSSHFGGGSPHPTARLFVLSHRPVPGISEAQTLVTTSVEDVVAAARAAAGDKDVFMMGGGHRFFQELPEHVHLRLLAAVPAPGVTHLHYEVAR